MGFLVERGCHVANGCHLITLRLDTALIDGVSRGGVGGEVFYPPQVPAGPAETPWLSSSGGGLTPCRARLPGKGGFSIDNVLLLWHGLGLSDLLVGPLNLLVSCTLAWSWSL